MNKAELVEKIRKYSQSYYEGRAEITDAEFDKLVEELRSIDPDNDILSKTGWGYEVAEDNKIKHIFPVTGISTKVRTTKELMAVYPDDSYAVISPKLDGGSVILYYRPDGGKMKLDKALSRGDGIYGVDITNTMKRVPSVVKEFDIKEAWGDSDFKSEIDPNLFAIRGEIIIPENNTIGVTTFRNSAVGFSQLKSADNYSDEQLAQHLFIPYTWINKPKRMMDDQVWSLFTDLGFIPIPYEIIPKDLLVSTFDTESEHLALKDDLSVITDTRINQDWKLPIDGLVLSNFEWDKFIAFKYDTDAQVSEVIGVTWNANRTGRFTPILQIKPLKFEDGSTVTNVTGNNLGYMKSLRSGIGSKIVVTKSGGIIPKLLKVVEPSDNISAPTKCLVCNSELVDDGVHLTCKNELCGIKTREPIAYNVRANAYPKYFNEATYNELTEWFKWRYLPGVYNLDEYETLKAIIGKSKDEFEFGIMLGDIAMDNSLTDVRKKFFKEFLCNLREQSISRKLSNYLACANIPSLGEVFALKIAENITKDETLVEPDGKVWLQLSWYLSGAVPFPKNLLSGTNVAVEENVVKYQTNLELLWDLLGGFTNIISEDKSKVEENSDLPKICLTNLGGSPKTKAEIAEMFKGQYQFVDYVDKTVSKVVFCKEGSSKMKKAESLGIEVQSVFEFLK